jgi:hypothetical protein
MALSQCIKRRHLAQKKFEFHAGVKKCHFGNFSERALFCRVQSGKIIVCSGLFAKKLTKNFSVVVSSFENDP